MTPSVWLQGKTDFILENLRADLDYPFESFERVPKGWINTAHFFGTPTPLTIAVGTARDPLWKSESTIIDCDDCVVYLMQGQHTFDSAFLKRIAAAVKQAEVRFNDAYPLQIDNWVPMIGRLLIEVQWRSEYNSRIGDVVQLLSPIQTLLPSRLRYSHDLPELTAGHVSNSALELLAQSKLYKEVELEFKLRMPEHKVVQTLRHQFPKCPDCILGSTITLREVDDSVECIAFRARQF